MNIAEAVRAQSLLAWLTDTEPDPNATGIAVSAARYLADRAHRALGAGPDADQIEAALRRRLAAGSGGAEDRLVQLADLLRPCPRPDFGDGWTLCAHAEPWPCVITRAAWLAAGSTETEVH